MIRKRSGRVTATQEIPTASLADISFLLLIFFLSTTMFAVEHGIPLVLPGAGSATVKVKRSAVVVVRANPDGTIEIEKEPVPLGRLRAIIEAKLAENADLIVVLETHPDSEYGLMVDILDELRLADARRISLKSGEAGK
jgi:biopolymer transport protein ExbD